MRHWPSATPNSTAIDGIRVQGSVPLGARRGAAGAGNRLFVRELNDQGLAPTASATPAGLELMGAAQPIGSVEVGRPGSGSCRPTTNLFRRRENPGERPHVAARRAQTSPLLKLGGASCGVRAEASPCPRSLVALPPRRTPPQQECRVGQSARIRRRPCHVREPGLPSRHGRDLGRRFRRQRVGNLGAE